MHRRVPVEYSGHRVNGLPYHIGSFKVSDHVSKTLVGFPIPGSLIAILPQVVQK
jgi:hypothetical protein